MSWTRFRRTGRGAKIRGATGLGAFPVALAAVLGCACAATFLSGAGAAQGNLSRNALWEIVNNLCVPGQTQNHDPKPCVQVDLSHGIEKGFAILKDLRGATQFLLVPTTRISGIESPAILEPDAANYFDGAWEAQTYVNDTLHRILPRDDIGLAINSAESRSQDALHIHIDCVREDVFEALHKNEGQIGNTWTRFQPSLLGHPYWAMWVRGEHLGTNNPFRLLAQRFPARVRDMGDRTLVVIGLTRADGTKGFVILADEVNRASGDFANGEELLDHSCRLATTERQLPGQAR